MRGRPSGCLAALMLCRVRHAALHTLGRLVVSHLLLTNRDICEPSNALSMCDLRDNSEVLAWRRLSAAFPVCTEQPWQRPPEWTPGAM